MYAVEFQAKIKEGTIEIPELYRNRIKERVRVIILLAAEESTDEESSHLQLSGIEASCQFIPMAMIAALVGES